MEQMKRTVTCGGLSKAESGTEVVLNGWVHRNRDHGGIQFISLRDRYGITQVVIDQDAPEDLKEIARSLKNEYCIAVAGVVRTRPDSMVNKEMATGEIEVAGLRILILSTCEVLPFMIDEAADAREEIRLKYRFLDLRTQAMQNKVALRHKATWACREFFVKEGFYEIETPTLIRSTPEGARDMLVPARLSPGKFFALPQSPQLFKQILMVSGMDKYFQIARCYRDEDARGDRQLEFTQIDLEMSFVSKEEVLSVIEGMTCHIFRETLGLELKQPFQRFTYREVMDRFGSDKPDLRFEMELMDFTDIAGSSDFQAFASVVKDGGVVKALKVPGCASYSRKQIENLEETAKIYGAKGLAWMKVTGEGVEGGIAKFFQKEKEAVLSTFDAQPDDLLLFVADEWSTACTALGAVRNKLGEDLKLKTEGEFVFCWVIDFPLFEWNKDENRWDPMHHMFSMPQDRYLATLEEDPGNVMGDLYDFVCNGYELGSGSIRIHDPEIQKKIFKIVGFSEEEAMRRFGFLLNAFLYGAPPHGGIALGLDRLIMLMAGEKTIREVIPFPKNTAGISPMEDSPSLVEEEQLKELHLKLDLPKKE